MRSSDGKTQTNKFFNPLSVRGRRAEAHHTNNVGDFKRFPRACEVHAGIIFISEGDLLGSEQIIIAIVKKAVAAIYTELEAGRDMVNRVLYIAAKGTKNFDTLPPDMSK